MNGGVISMSRTIIPMEGRTFGHCTVIERVEDNNRRLQYLCRCECGNEFEALGENLRSLHTQSCGCYRDNKNRKLHEKHKELSYYNHSPEYKTWKSLRGRCNNPNNPKYSRYGGRGIKVDERWNDYANFLKDMGRRPSNKHTIDRINNDGNYSPENCRWATRTEQSRNRSNTLSLTFNGITKTLQEWSEQTGLDYSALQWRRNSGWPVDEILTIPSGGLRHASTKH